MVWYMEEDGGPLKETDLTKHSHKRNSIGCVRRPMLYPPESRGQEGTRGRTDRIGDEVRQKRETETKRMGVRPPQPEE